MALLALQPVGVVPAQGPDATLSALDMTRRAVELDRQKRLNELAVTAQAEARETAQARATEQAEAWATAQVAATGTARANATATVRSATATAQARATATAGAMATLDARETAQAFGTRQAEIALEATAQAMAFDERARQARESAQIAASAICLIGAGVLALIGLALAMRLVVWAWASRPPAGSPAAQAAVGERPLTDDERRAALSQVPLPEDVVLEPDDEARFVAEKIMESRREG